MGLSVVISAFSLLFLAEMGDKSQLLAMTLAHRYRARPVIAGTFAAFALLNLLAVFVGQALFEWIPQELMLLAAAGLFLYFGYRSWRDADGGEDEESDGVPAGGALVTSFTFAAHIEKSARFLLTTGASSASALEQVIEAWLRSGHGLIMKLELHGLKGWLAGQVIR